MYAAYHISILYVRTVHIVFVSNFLGYVSTKTWQNWMIPD